MNVSGWGSYNSSGYRQGNTGKNSVDEPVYGGLSNQGGSGLGFTSVINGKQETGTSPHHAFDNHGNGNPTTGSQYGADNELLLLNFGSAKVNLTQIQTGWSTNDTDVMVFRWNGSDKTSSEMNTIMGNTLGPGGLIAAGWDLVSAKDLDNNPSSWTTTEEAKDRTFDLKTGSGYTVDEDNKVSSWWLVTTYFSGTGVSLGDTSKDYFKLLSFTGRACTSTVSNGTCVEDPKDPPPAPAPEPASMALAGLALAGLAAQRRRRQVAAAWR